MHPISRFILFFGISFVLVSILYFLGLILHFPFIIIPVVSIAILFFIGKWFFKKELQPAENKISIWAVAALGIGLFSIVNAGLPTAEVHGDWDAWAIWNLHAKYLINPDHWMAMMRNTENGHPDYPLGLPAFIAFCVRLCDGHFSVLIPFIISAAFTIAIPTFIFLNTQKRSLLVGILVLYFFSHDLFYLKRGLAQMADTPLAFFFLCAIACIYHARENKQYVALSAFFAASCMWMKNEGALLALMFFLLNANTFLRPANLKYVIPAVLIPILAFGTFKYICDIDNDMLSRQGSETLSRLSDKSRYKMVYEVFAANLNENFFYIKIATIVYLGISILGKRIPDRQFLILLICLAAYLGVYIISPNDLEWHLRTSLDRLMHQLMPTFIFVLAQQFASLRFTNIKFTTIKFPHRG